jgi:phage FluMu protein gp41
MKLNKISYKGSRKCATLKEYGQETDSVGSGDKVIKRGRGDTTNREKGSPKSTD